MYVLKCTKRAELLPCNDCLYRFIDFVDARSSHRELKHSSSAQWRYRYYGGFSSREGGNNIRVHNIRQAHRKSHLVRRAKIFVFKFLTKNKTGVEKIPGKSVPPKLKKRFLLTNNFGGKDLPRIFSAPVFNLVRRTWSGYSVRQPYIQTGGFNPVQVSEKTTDRPSQSLGESLDIT